MVYSSFAPNKSQNANNSTQALDIAEWSKKAGRKKAAPLIIVESSKPMACKITEADSNLHQPFH